MVIISLYLIRTHIYNLFEIFIVIFNHSPIVVANANLWDDVAAEEHAAGHELAVAGVALDHLVARLEAQVGDLGDAELLVEGPVRGDDRRVGGQWEVDPRVGDQVAAEYMKVIKFKKMLI